MIPIEFSKTIYCPFCGTHVVAEILYGDIDLSDYKDELDQKLVFYGGKMVREYGPHWLCNECKKAWCKDSDEYYMLDEFGEFILIP
jgi:hypothetical protein